MLLDRFASLARLALALALFAVGACSRTRALGDGPPADARDAGDATRDASAKATGTCRWSKAIGGSDVTIAIAPAGDMFVVGQITPGAGVDVGCGPMETTSAPGQLFAAKLDVNGRCLWSRPYDGYVSGYGPIVASDSSGALVITGTINAPKVDLGCGAMDAIAALFVGKLDGQGRCVWSKSVGQGVDPGEAMYPDLVIGRSIAADSDDNLLVGGSFLPAQIDFGCGPLSTSAAISAFVAKLGPDGKCLWSRKPLQQRDDYQSSSLIAGVAADGAGNGLVVGSFGSPGSVAPGFDFGCGSAAATKIGMFLAKVDPRGRCIWSRNIDNAGGEAIAVDPAGDLVVGGSFGPDTKAIDIGCGPLPVTDGQPRWGTVFAAKISADGSCRWSRHRDGPTGGVVAVDGRGNTIAARGGFADGGCARPAFPAYEPIATKLDAAGVCLWTNAARRSVQGDLDPAIFLSAVAVDRAGNVAVAGRFRAEIDLGCGATRLQRAGDHFEAFIAQLEP